MPALKRISLLAGGRVWAELGAQNRVRLESWRNFGFGGLSNDDAYVLNRLLLRADLNLGRRVRAAVEAKSAVLTDRDLPGGRRPVGADDFDLQNAYLELTMPVGGGAALAVRSGRQALRFGGQRLVSPLDWANTRRTFDAIRGTVRVRDWSVDGLFAHPVRVIKEGINRRDARTDLLSLHAEKTRGRLPEVNLYWLVLVRDSATGNGTTGPETRHTVGVRVSGSAAQRLEYEVETAYQFGRLGPGAISAAMLGAEMSVDIPGAPASARLHAGVDAATGDRASGAGSSVSSPSRDRRRDAFREAVARRYPGYVALVRATGVAGGAGPAGAALGAYTVRTFDLADVMQLPLLLPVARAFGYVALLSWLITLAGLIHP